MLGGSCSPCCTQCKTSAIPESIEIDIESSHEQEFYGWIKYRTGRVAFQSLCETNHADSYLSLPITSGTYVLSKTFQNSQLATYSYSDTSFAIEAVVSDFQDFIWAGNFANRRGPGVYVTLSPLRITATMRSASVSSGVAVEPVSKASMEQQSTSINANTIYSGTESGVSFRSFSIGDSSTSAVSSSKWVYASFIQPCVGGLGLFNPLASDNIATYAISSASIIPLSSIVSWPLGHGTMTDDMSFLEAFDTFSSPGCGRGFAMPYFIGAGGDFALTSESTNSSYYINSQPYPLHLVAYGASVTRDFTISAMRGMDAQGAEVQIL